MATFRNLDEFWNRISFQIGNRCRMFNTLSRPKHQKAKLNQHVKNQKLLSEELSEGWKVN